MITKVSSSDNSKKKISPITGFGLFIVSVILISTTGIIGLIYGLFSSTIKRGIQGLGEYFLQIAISIDQLGNVVMQHILNDLWITKDGYKFGNRDETISSAIGKNQQMGTLTAFGDLIRKLLDFIDPNHSLNSIDYNIEP